ncbi:hypothetical protein OXPF_39090 [Oxobacter pfennigii]|uniref:Uncharacterized protein n=1 Tax=Oxobacter pfennigii TaxID=36849 RepID=A0A0P8W3Z3_9CLOT|nr:hypothetical protein OXPF_39090 [Oxobacter pfennigii]
MDKNKEATENLLEENKLLKEENERLKILLRSIKDCINNA